MTYLHLSKAVEYILDKHGKQISHSTLRGQINKGRIKAVKMAKAWFVELSELDRYATEIMRK